MQLLTRAVEAEQDPVLAREIAGLRAALSAHGLGQAHTHFRLNATQLHNAIRRQIGLDTSPADPSRRRSYISAINELLARAEPVSINTGSLISERASAKRMFMMIAQLAKHIDSETPIRFLIAETETAFTLLVALYFARLFGVEHLVEISPLFETETALEHGDAVIDEALRSPHYRAYVERTGRLCVQFGYSDSGRYIGQMAATYWIERLHFKIGAVLARHGLSGIQVVLFDTHGESVGRGGHPVSLTDRLNYISPPASRAAFAKAGLAVKQESSFQGGDGYLNFLAPEIAFASLSRIVETMLAPDESDAPDPIYAQGDFTAEFFAVVRQEFSHLVDDPNYAALLGAFGTNMLDRTGSRPVQRQHEWVAAKDFAHLVAAARDSQQRGAAAAWIAGEYRQRVGPRDGQGSRAIPRAVARLAALPPRDGDGGVRTVAERSRRAARLCRHARPRRVAQPLRPHAHSGTARRAARDCAPSRATRHPCAAGEGVPAPAGRLSSAARPACRHRQCAVHAVLPEERREDWRCCTRCASR